MHTPGTGTNAVPAFLTKLWKLVDDSSCDDLISWSENGSSFIIHNQSRFSKELLPLYFKHNNLASFIRQLNMYGFRKVVHLEQNGLREDMEFYHHLFVKGSEGLLSMIKRKVPVGRTAGENLKSKPDLIETVLENVQNIQGRQENVDIQLATMKRENEALWREVALLRQKHLKQQQIVERLIQFLVTIVQPGCNVGLKRKQPLMIDNANMSDSNKKARSSKSNPFSHLGTDFQFSVDTNSLGTANGPVIHDVTESLEASEFLNGTARTSPTQIVTNIAVDSPCSGKVESPASSGPVDSPLNPVEQVELLDLLNPLKTDVGALATNCDIPTPITEAPVSSPPPLVLDVSKVSTSSTLNTPPPLDDLESGSLAVHPNTSLSLVTPVLSNPTVLDVDKQNKASEEQNKTTPNTSEMQVAISDNQLIETGYSNTFENDWKLSMPTNQKSNSIADHVDGVDNELEWLQDNLPNAGLQVDPAILLGVCHSWDKWLSSNSKLFSIEDQLPMGNMITEGNGEEKNKSGTQIVECEPDVFEFDWSNPGSSVSSLPKITASSTALAPSVSAEDFLASPTDSLDKETDVMEELFGDTLGTKIMEIPPSMCEESNDPNTSRKRGHKKRSSRRGSKKLS